MTSQNDRPNWPWSKCEAHSVIGYLKLVSAFSYLLNFYPDVGDIRQARNQLTNLRQEIVREICHDETALQLLLAQTDQIAQRYQFLAYLMEQFVDLMERPEQRIRFIMPIGHA